MPQTPPNEVHTMTLDHTIRNAIGKVLAGGAALYVGICGLPGLAGKEDVQVSQQPPAAEQQLQGSYLERAANELFGQSTAMAEDTTSQPSIVEMYDWDGVCREKSEYYSKVPAANGECWLAEGDDFIEAVNNDRTVRYTLKQNGLLEPLNAIQKSKTDSLSFVTITDRYFELAIDSTIDNYSDMKFDSMYRYFVFEQLSENDIDELRPYFEESL